MFKRYLMIAIIFLLLFSVLSPNALSNETSKNYKSFGFKEIFTAYPIIEVTYPHLEELATPNSGALDIPLATTFKLTGRYAKFIEQRSLLRNAIINIELKIVNTPDWCYANISNSNVQLPLDHTEPFKSTLTVTVTEKAPAFSQGVVKISATSKILRGIIFNIAEQTAEFDISFIIGYWSAVSFQPKGNIAEIGPYDTADFQIDIENLGNGPTYVKIETMDYPKEEWDVNIASSVVLSSAVDGGEGNSKSVYLKIKPSIDSDWNNKRQTFKVKFSPSYLGQPYLTGQEEIIIFIVQKIGSLKDEESDNNFLIILVTAVVLVILISIFLKWRHLN